MPDDATTWIAPDGTRLGYKNWIPVGKARAIVLAMHGLGCRETDFAPLAEVLVARGIQLAAWNLRGQGLDPVVSRRGVWLDAEETLVDLDAFANHLAIDEAPVFLAGESMGALLAIQAAVKTPWAGRIRGLLLFTPVVGLAQKNPPWIKSLLLALAAVAPGLRLKPSWFVHGKASAPTLTRDREHQLAVETAPHRLGPTTIRFLASMGDLIEAAVPAARQLRVPVAVFSAGHDAFVTTAQVAEFFDAIPAGDKTHFHYEESYHQLMFDLDAPRVLGDAAAWIEARSATQTSP